MHRKARGCTCTGQNLKETVLWGVPSSRGLNWDSETYKLKRSIDFQSFSFQYGLLRFLWPLLQYFSCNSPMFPSYTLVRAQGTIGRAARRALFPPLLNPFTARVLDRVSWGDSNFWVCGWNRMMWPFKWTLSTCIYTWCYLFFKISQNEIWTFGWNLLLAKFGSERVKQRRYSCSGPSTNLTLLLEMSFKFPFNLFGKSTLAF